MSGIFGGGEKQTPEFSVVADPYKDVREPMIAWLKGEIGQPTDTYDKDIVADSSPQEKQSLDFLQKYVDQGESESTGLAKDELSKTMQGDYDPTSSPYYQAVKAESARNLEETQKQIADQASGGAGRFYSGARIDKQGDASTDASLAMNKLLYGMAETERQRRYDAIPTAANMGRAEEESPLRKTTALQSAGGLERILQQARNESIYNEWLRSTQEYPMQVGALASGLSKEPYYAQSTESEGGGGMFGKLLGGIAGSMLGGMFSGGGGSSLGKAGSDRSFGDKGQIGSYTGYRTS